LSISEPFIRRPVATTLLTIAILISGMLSYWLLPVSPLPQVDLPTISVSASFPGASPETMATAVATPLERTLSRIAGVTEMTSNSTLGSTGITLQFELNRDINAAARDVQAAINAARSQLPQNLPNNPSYRMVNAADSPIMMLSLISDTIPKDQLYDIATTQLQQMISQVPGVGQVNLGGGSGPAVRVEINPTVMNQMGLSLEDVRLAIANANVNRPTGSIMDDHQASFINVNDQMEVASEYMPLIVAYRNGAAVRLRDIASVTDSVEDTRQFGIFDGVPSISVLIYRQPNANILDTVDRIRSILPTLRAQVPAAIEIAIGFDRTTTIRAAIEDVQFTLWLSVVLVMMVVYAFLRDWRFTLVTSVSVPVSLVGTFTLMYLANYSINNLSLMALTIATGFVVDDAIVVTENINRYLEKGYSGFEAACIGAKEIGFTVLSISVSLIAVFIPILLMGGVVGRLFQEFAIVLSSAILISLVVSLTTTPMLCAILLRSESHGNELESDDAEASVNHGIKEGFVLAFYRRSLTVVVDHPAWTLLVFLATIVLNVYLFVIVPKGFFPQQDNGRLIGSLVADQGTSFKAMSAFVREFANKISEDPDVDHVLASTGGGGGGANVARFFVTLNPLGKRKLSVEQVISNLRSRLSGVTGANLFLQGIQDLRLGGRTSSSQFQYTMRGSNLRELNEWSAKMLVEMRKIPGIVDVNSDQQDRGVQTRLVVDRQLASRLGVDFQEIDNTLYDAFGQRFVSTIYLPLNQHRVVMQLSPEFAKSPESLKNVYVRSSSSQNILLSDLYEIEQRNTSLAVAHSGLFPSSTISFNLLPGVSLSSVVPLIEEQLNQLDLPDEIFGKFSGTAQAFQDSLETQPFLILAALVSVYIVLGILYESYIHPLTILSTLPAAGVGAILALLVCGMEFNIVGLIGILLLIGIVKKNAIMMIDFALSVQRTLQMPPREAIIEACVLRFRPIIMTTVAALLGAMPMAVGWGNGAELRQPLGVTIVGGLLVSQLVTLYTTPVLYLLLERLFRR
jgi:multidrug efflux pump